jgi:NAD(P)-dependent dehydrogenase (short-subunit alcohol dehydrogenase family)
MHQGRDETVNRKHLVKGTAGAIGLMAAGAAIALFRAKRRKRYSFRDKSVVIIGGSRGLGLELARLFAKEGAHLALIARTAATLDKARIELEKSGARVLAIPCDVRDQKQVEDAIGETIRQFGRIDVLINNAGVIQVGPYDQMRLHDYEDAMATHAWGPLYTIMAALPHMRRQASGRIVNIVSIGGKIGVPHLLPYTMSKFALSGLSQGLRSEIARDGILLTAIYPGLMRTGSHINASFKGRHRSEFAWFSVSAGMPLLSIDARRAARQIVRACRTGRAELTITPQARVAAIANTAFPSVVAQALRTANSFLPQGELSSDQEHKGWESTSRWSPSFLTRFADDASERNNEVFQRSQAG